MNLASIMGLLVLAGVYTALFYSIFLFNKILNISDNKPSKKETK